MKKFKKILLLLFCTLCVCLTFSFAGCNNGGSYVDRSFDYAIGQTSSYYSQYEVDGSFKIKVGKAGKYNVSYTITTNGYCWEQKNTGETTVTVSKDKENEETMVYISVYFNKIGSNYNSDAYISDVRVEPLEKNTEDNAYAIGFGAVGGAVLIASVVVFVLDKRGKLSMKK
ncbi:MAG: hypothetical protein K2N47_02840 [Clostridia bacterium]|nr:hypothetical protein [Clostridia bacterium]